MYAWYLGLRHAHLAAAREQAVERVERISQRQRGWGLGSFGIRRQQRRRRAEEAVAQQKEYEMDEFDAGEDADAEGEGAGESAGEGGVVREREGHWEGEMRARRVVRKPVAEAPRKGLDDESHRPSSVWWWGPLQRWRLQDSTDYRS